jgi:hypothetical protein
MWRPTTLLALVLLAGCLGQDTNAPVPQQDTPIFGRIAAIREVGDEPGTWEVDISTRIPVALEKIMREQGRTVPQLEKDLTSRVKVTPDTVCIADGRATDLDAFRVGQEVAVMPTPGSSAMVGTRSLLATAAELYLFASYQVRFLPRTLDQVPRSIVDRTDPSRINSSGVERAPIPLRGGAVVYFAAGLLPAVQPNGAPRGAVRAGMRDETGKLAPWVVGGYRPYRVAWERDGWGQAAPVALAGLEPDASARITWVNDDETVCLVEVDRPDKSKTLFASRRAGADEQWGALARVARAVGGSTGDGQYLGHTEKALVWTVYDANGSDLWLDMGKGGQPLEPRINTLGSEWAPRVGPNTTLYFCRGERQLLFAGGMVNEVRLPGKQRHPLLEAVPTEDGKLLFFTVPRYTPGPLDTDLAVAPAVEGGWGTPVPLDEWVARKVPQ